MSRASILTGQYAHRHGIIDNVDRTEQSHQLMTFPRILHDAGEGLLELINGILDLSKVEAGKVELCVAPLELAAARESP